ncbi:MAG: barstar family protein [Azoarcus sp.]|nr:barstar family protein [Azoarcus sp.]
MTPPYAPENLLELSNDGLYRCESNRIDTLIAQAQAGGVDVRCIELADCRDKADLLERIAATLAFPAWFGHNWDALADCLADLGWLPDASARMFVFEHLDATREPGTTLLDILSERADDLGADAPPLWLLVTDPISDPKHT